MIYAAYNGIPMRSLGNVDQMRQVVYTQDGTQPVGVFVDFKGVFMLNPAMLSAIDFANADRGVYEPPTEGAGGRGMPPSDLTPAELFVLATARLEVPRRPFVVWSYAGAGRAARRVIFLQSPQKDADGNFMHSDMEDGPTPKVTECKFDQGHGSILLGFNVETTIPLCTAASAPLLVANRWEMEAELDNDRYARHTITGRAVFRKDLLTARGLTPGMLTSWFAHPIPMGFRRETVALRYDPKGHAVDYSYIDTEQAVNQPGVQAYGAARVEVAHQKEHVGPSPYGFVQSS